MSKGSGNIKGIKLCASVDDCALIPVEVIGVAFSGGGYRTGVHVTVRPIGGHGELTMDPLSLIDDTDAARDLFRRKSEAATACRLYGDVKSDRERKTKLLDMRESLTAEQKKIFDEAAEDRFGKGADMVKSIGKASGDWELRHLFQRCVKIKFDVLDAEDYSNC